MDDARRYGGLTAQSRWFKALSMLAWAGATCTAFPSVAAELRAGPGDFQTAVKMLRAGDTLVLEPGVYTGGLDIHGIAGTPDATVTIAGTRGAKRSVFIAQRGRNTISIVDSSYVRIADLDLVGANAAVDAVKAEGTSRFAHHIVIEGLRISGYAASQQNVGISTKCPAWNWTIRNNRIRQVGTGLYLGDSDGSAPFVRGVIEGNVIRDTRGYSLQIKHQGPWPEQLSSLPATGQTVIRYNTFAKLGNGSTGELARPNLLLGHWPLSGSGSGDRYLVYGNLFLDNPTETLLQAEGNVSIYNNVFVNRLGDAVAIREHNDVPRDVDVFHNTIVARGTGLLLRNAAASGRQIVAGNAIFAMTVVPARLANDNAVHPYGEAGSYLRRVSAEGMALDLAPREGQLVDRQRTAALDEALPDANLDFDRKRRSIATFGAYAAGAPAAVERFRP